MARRSTLRASDADREHIAERLRKAASEGRLLAEELEERIEAALTARTYGELDGLVADLPVERAPAPRAGTLTLLKRPAIVLGVIVLALAVLAVVALIITGTILAGGAWLFLGLWFFGCRGRRYHGRYARPRDWQQVRGPAHWRI
jgi:hypothetical protein